MIELKKIGVTATALGLFALAAPAVAQELEVEEIYTPPTVTGFVFHKTYDESTYVDWKNSVDVSIEKSLDISYSLTYSGSITIDGSIEDIFTAAIALVDNKQISDHNSSVDTSDLNEALIYDITVSGNFQGNAASGNLNQQENVAAIAEVAAPQRTYTREAKPFYGSANAEVYGVQKLWENVVFANKRPGYHRSHTYYRYDNYAGIYDVTANGNTQANVAAGNLNQQKNALAIAVAADSALSEATSVVLQEIHKSTAWADSANYAGIWDISGSGNFQGNSAAGNMNQQLNVLSIAATNPGGGT